jgi:hypothetical protein
VIEGHGIPTLMAGTALDIMRRVTPPRAVFVDHPVGRTFGPPHDRRRNETILARVLAELPNFTEPGEIRDPGFHWAPDGSRAWEDELRAEMLHDR